MKKIIQYELTAGEIFIRSSVSYGCSTTITGWTEKEEFGRSKAIVEKPNNI